MKILVVEDNEDSRILLTKQLRAYGHEVIAAADGVEALEQALIQPPDIIISDIMMPNMDGYQLCRECKQNEQLKDIPFVFYTATYTLNEDKKFARSLGAATFIIKPAEPDVFIQKLSEIVEKIQSGALAPAKVASLEPSLFLTEYNKRVVAKLEDKVAQLEIEITQRKQAEEEIQLAEQNFRNSLENSPLGIRIVTAEGKPLYANQAILDIYGYSSVEELKAVPTKQRYTPESYAGHQKRKEKRKQGKPAPPNYEISIVRKDGEIRHLVVSRKEVVWNGETQFQTLYQDFTERKQAEEELREAHRELEQSEQKYRELVGNINDGYLVVQDQRVAFSNVRAAEMVGYTLEEGIGKPIQKFLAPEVVNAVVERYERMLRGEAVPQQYEALLLRKDGTKLPVEFSVEHMQYGGRPGISVLIRDITERKQAEDEIKRAVEEWETTFNSITDLVSIHDKDFRLVKVNKAFADVFKMKPEELIGKYCYEVVHGANEPAPYCPHKQALADGRPHRAEFFEPHLGIHLEITASPIFDEKGEVVGTVHIVKDITERKKMEEQLIVTDRLASVGELASGIAHELNNPLTSVIGFSDLLLSRDIPDDVKEDLEVINKEAQRTARVVRNLLVFARGHPQEKKSVDVNKIIENVLELRAYEQKVSSIAVNTQFASDLPEITADGFQLQQVFLNIIINAEHFMIEAHNRGTLTITTERLGDIIRASFADDGPGIAKENLGHLFDPFFTTKEVGKGTGLGLSICHGIITEHGGRIYAESKLGKGATFVVELPISKS